MDGARRALVAGDGVTWVRLDDSFAQHPKVVAAGPLAMAMQVAALCYCNKNLTNGFVPWSTARSLISWQFLEPDDGNGHRISKVAVTCGMRGDDVNSEYVIVQLLEAGMWDEVPNGYMIHDYGDYQPSREQVEQEREATRQRVTKHRNGKGNAVTNGKVTPMKRTSNNPPVPETRDPYPYPVSVPKPKTENDSANQAVEQTRDVSPDSPLGSALDVLIHHHNELFGVPSKTRMTELREWSGRVPAYALDAIPHAFDEAAINNKLSWGYVKAVLTRQEEENWPEIDDGGSSR